MTAEAVQCVCVRLCVVLHELRQVFIKAYNSGKPPQKPLASNTTTPLFFLFPSPHQPGRGEGYTRILLVSSNMLEAGTMTAEIRALCLEITPNGHIASLTFFFPLFLLRHHHCRCFGVFDCCLDIAPPPDWRYSDAVDLVRWSLAHFPRRHNDPLVCFVSTRRRSARLLRLSLSLSALHCLPSH